MISVSAAVLGIGGAPQQVASGAVEFGFVPPLAGLFDQVQGFGDKLMDKLGMGTQPALLARRRSVGPTSSTSVPTLPVVKSGAGGAVRGAGAAGHHHKLALSDAE